MAYRISTVEKCSQIFSDLLGFYLPNININNNNNNRNTGDAAGAEWPESLSSG